MKRTNKTIYRIAHLSDTHISPEYNRHNVGKLRSLLAFVVDEGYDHIVLTGDITGQGEDRDFRSVRRLLKYFGLLDYERLSVTIGNHDIFGGVHRAEDLFSFKTHCRTVNYADKLKAFEQAFKETLPKKAYPSQEVFPFVKIVGPAALVGMNSVSKFHAVFNPFGSNGQILPEQIQAAETILRHPTVNGLKKILLIHHHFNKYQPLADSIAKKLYHKFEGQTLKLHGRKWIAETFGKIGVDAVLHGHTHVDEIYGTSGVLYSSTALDSIRAKSDTGRNEESLAFNELAIDGDGEIEIRRRPLVGMPKGSSYIREKNHRMSR
ncbi:MAG: metallophosphoesterase [Bacteroidetes bacterium]|nr:metallophosphoesterase [Bacteroidota bacterium]